MIQAGRRKDRTCEVVGCEAKHLAKGMCRKHYKREQKRRATEWVVLPAVCHRWSALAPKVKAVKCRHTVGIMPRCPSCNTLMRAQSPNYFICAACFTDAQFSSEEVEWLASETRLKRQSRRTLA